MPPDQTEKEEVIFSLALANLSILATREGPTLLCPFLTFTLEKVQFFCNFSVCAPVAFFLRRDLLSRLSCVTPMQKRAQFATEREWKEKLGKENGEDFSR